MLEDVRPTAALRYDTPEPAAFNKYAIASLLAVFIFPVAAIVFGHLALRDINLGRGVGRKTALAGTVFGYLGAAIVTATIMFILIGVIVIGQGGKIIIGTH